MMCFIVHKLKSVFILVLSCSIVPACFAQKSDVREALLSIQSFYTGDGYKHLKGMMTLSGQQSGKKVDQVQFEFWLQGENSRSKMNYMEVFRNKTLYVQANHKAKTILARTVSPGVPGSPEIFDVNQLNTLLDGKGVESSLLKGDSVHVIRMSKLQGGPFSTIEVRYSVQDHHIIDVSAVLQVQERGREANVLRVHYSHIERLQTAPDLGVFQPSHYVQLQNDRVTGYHSRYSTYKKL